MNQEDWDRWEWEVLNKPDDRITLWNIFEVTLALVLTTIIVFSLFAGGC